MLYRIVKSAIKPFLKLFYKIEVKGLENIPQDGGCIVCSNHYHWLDPIMVACFTNRQVHYMAKKELFKNKFLNNFLKRIGAFPVNRGAADISAIKNALRIVKENKVLGIFPEGTRVKSKDQLPAEPGIAMIGIKGKATIVPIGISGNYTFRSSVTMNVGQPISLEKYYGKKSSIKEFESISEEIMVEVRNLIDTI
ncbi:1-acyl-sn-glycerol-3-phosphate acyltransferase [Irregularibacter muris]|uniref:1-acyl-sn-glycerol-3-phosphate acyltransferase n=1 Tax=Irregularibacter muris TaxID=1796619 RepID=A0AAE3HCW3_9FIRM|nr:lysophospholipid acyltransferase family protein [Irregularibacter muris]MCR1898062.1 1-acyl-sn-glycerol-3-phosphate acyltransferase [Irregularibacter muris]